MRGRLVRIATCLCVVAVAALLFAWAPQTHAPAAYAIAATLVASLIVLLRQTARHTPATHPRAEAAAGGHPEPAQDKPDESPAPAAAPSEDVPAPPSADETAVVGSPHAHKTSPPDGSDPAAEAPAQQAHSVDESEGGQAPADLPAQATSHFEEPAQNPGGQAEADEPTAPVPTQTVDAVGLRDVHREARHDDGFDFDRFRHALLLSANPLATLRSMVRRASRRQREGTASGVEQFLVRQLGEAGLADVAREEHGELAGVSVAWPHRSRTFYLRTATERMTYGSKIALIAVEAILNAVNTAYEYYADALVAVSEQDILRLWQRTRSSICAQVPDVDTADWSYLAMPWQIPFGPADQGEWSVRQSMAEAIESVRVPYRLEARFRCNVSEGDVAIEFSVTPDRAFPHSAYADGLGIVATTSATRRREASAYAARVGLLLANHAFRSSSKIRRVWVAAVRETPSAQECLYSVCMGRRAFSHVRMGAVSDPMATLQSLGASMTVADGCLMPSEPCFYLEDKRFCPARRHDLWQLSERSLSAQASRSLGAARVSGLLIHEELPLALAADEMLRGLVAPQAPGATEQSVRAILDVARQTSDLSVWSAADRVVAKLVDGKLATDDPYAVREELIEGDPLSKALNQAQRQLMEQRPRRALRTLDAVLDPLERSGAYDDTPAVAYRNFDSFAERVVYNRTNAGDRRSVVLVPDAYLAAHLLCSAILSSLPSEMGGSQSEALRHAMRAAQVAPYSVSASMALSACLQATEDLDGAAQALIRFLRTAHNPHAMAMAYFRLATIEAELGLMQVGRACFQRCVQLFPPLFPFVVAAYAELAADAEEGVSLMGDDELAQVLEEHGIPLAPTQQTAFILYDGATASVDAEVFPVALDLLQALVTLTGDDVLRGIRSSLEHEPDA